MLHIRDLDGDVDGSPFVGGPSLHIQDIRPDFGNRRGDLGEHSGTIFRQDGQRHGIGFRGGGRTGPFDFDFAVGLVAQILNVWTILRMHGDAFAAGDVPDHFLATNRVAAFCAIHQ